MTLLLTFCCRYSDIVVNSFEEAARQAGFPDDFLLDWNHPQASGLLKDHVSIRRGERDCPRLSYLENPPSNLHIFTGLTVEELEILPLPLLSKRVLTVVAKNSQGQRIRFLPTKDVVLSAGTFGTPEILMKSGIGDKNELQVTSSLRNDIETD